MPAVGHSQGLGTQDCSSGSAADFGQAPPSERASVCPSARQRPPKERGSRRKGSRRHLQEDLLLGQERQVLEGRRQVVSGPVLPPAPGLRSRAQASAQTPRGPESRAPGTRPAAPWTGGCPSPPLPRRAHSSTNSSWDAGNFLTSALGPRPRPVPAATAPGASVPGPAPSLKRSGDPSRFPPPAPSSGRSPATWRRGPGQGRTLRGGAQAARPRLHGGRGGARRVRACRLRMR